MLCQSFTEKQSQTITGTFLLRLQYLIDISESAFDQLQKMHNKQLDEGTEREEFVPSLPPAVNSQRVLKLELSDGERSVTAMEYSPIPCLHTKLSPGTMLLLSGSIRCVNHVLFLESKNIQLLGEKFCAPSNSDQMDRSLNPNPKMIYPGEYIQNVHSRDLFLAMHECESSIW